MHIYTPHIFTNPYMYIHTTVYTHIQYSFTHAHTHIVIHAHKYILKGHRILSSSRNARKYRDQDLENEQPYSCQNYFIDLAHEEGYQYLQIISYTSATTSIGHNRLSLWPHCIWKLVIAAKRELSALYFLFVSLKFKA